MPGTLFVVATPLGNLADLSPRALEVLRSVEAIACEDTRRTAKLLAVHGLSTPLVSYHRFNERGRLAPLLSKLLDGANIALVSDGGTPGISDPGALLVSAAIDAGVRVSPIPGPSAAAALISASGMAADRYVFEGFLPPRASQRRRRLRELAEERRPIVLYEAPHRLRETLADLGEILPGRQVVLGRELTKLHETIERGTAAEVAARVGDTVRGEITLVLGPSAGLDAGADAVARRTLECWRRALLESGGDARAARARAARELGLKKAELERLLDELGEPR